VGCRKAQVTFSNKKKKKRKKEDEKRKGCSYNQGLRKRAYVFVPSSLRMWEMLRDIKPDDLCVFSETGTLLGEREK
jgi:hypothetical protein